jgi:predicted transcriptional regulator
MVKKVLQIFACRHKHTSVPFPAVMASASSATLDENLEQPVTSDHYVVCLECGKRFSYDWSQMRLVRNRG